MTRSLSAQARSFPIHLLFMNINSLDDFKNPFFIGIAGTGMSALAQYLQGIGKNVSGSDRYFREGEANDTRQKLEQEGIRCFLQNGEGITAGTDLVVASTAIEENVAEMQQAKQRGIPVIRRSELLAMIAASRKTIAVGGTSGKSTTAAMLYEMLREAGLSPSIISGAGLVSIIKEGKIGNARVGKGELLVIEADESDGSIVQYRPVMGILLNVDKDHKEIDALMEMFRVFRDNSSIFIVNQSHPLARKLSKELRKDFSIDERINAGYMARNFVQDGLSIQFAVKTPEAVETVFTLNTLGRHNMENAVAAFAAAHQLGVKPEAATRAMERYEGIYRRHQVMGKKHGVWLVDDYAHNPAKCAASISACQPLAPKVVAWFQPHGYAPTKFLRTDFVNEIAASLRDSDEIWMSEIFYAGGTTTKDISSGDLIRDLEKLGKNAFFVADRDCFLEQARSHLNGDCVLLLMGARDPSLEQFARQVWEQL